MKEESRSKKSLIKELHALRKRLAELKGTAGQEHHQAERALNDAELRYEKLTEASFDGILVTEDGVIVEADDSAAAILRRDPGNLVGLEFKELVHEEDEANDHYNGLLTDGSAVEVDLLGRDGSQVPVELASATVSEAHGTAVTAIRDLRPLKAAEEKAEKTEERFRAIFEASPDIISLQDSNLRFTYVNPAMEELFGLPASKLVGAAPEELFDKQAAEQIRRWDVRVLNGETVQEQHTRSVNGDPRTFLDIRVPLRDGKGAIYGMCCISRDITDYRTTTPRKPLSVSEYPSKSMRSVQRQASKIAATDGTVLLLGESGSGKDYLARWIHDQSARSSGPYFAINCAALSSELAESELFGHESGAFTGARGRKKGMLELAEGGTLLLNEIGELPLPLQSKLLTFLDTMSFVRVGGERTVTVDARLMAATHRALVQEVSKGRFLEPLYYRLNVFAIDVPPLRERIEDLPLLVQQLMSRLAEKMNLSRMPVIDSPRLAGLAAYTWPGNVRELSNVIERALMLWDGGPLDLKLPSTSTTDDTWTRDLPFPSYWSLRDVTNEVTKAMCIEALRRTGGNKKDAAKVLGISRDALYRYIRRFCIDPEMLA